MYIQATKRQSNYNTSFQTLKIDTPKSWDGKLLQEFVHNFEVQKFVKYWHDKGINIIASQQGKFGIAMREDSLKSDRFLVGIFGHEGGLKNFKAIDKISQITQESENKIENSPLIKQAEKFVLMFNKALNKNKGTSIWNINE